MKNFILNVWESKSTVFTVNELANFIEYSSDSSLRLKISNYTKRWYVEKVGRWLYALPNKEINIFELANKIYSPSYISFFSALYHYGIIFQATPNEVFLAYKKSETKKLKNLKLEIHLKCLKESILLNDKWLTFTENYTIASPERAFLDSIYIYNNIYFDNLDILDIEKMTKIIPIYWKNTMMLNRIEKYFPNIKKYECNNN